MPPASFLLDRLIALKYAFGAISEEPFDMRDDRKCSFRVLTNLIMLGQLGDEIANHTRDQGLGLLGEYLAVGEDRALSSDLTRSVADAVAGQELSAEAISALVGRCVAGADWSVPGIPELNQRAAAAHLGVIDAMERHYRALVAEHPPAIGTDTPIVDFEALTRELGDGKPARLNVVHVINGGYSKVTVICDLEREGLPSRRLVVRSDAGLAFAGTSVLDEYPVLKRLYDAGVAVPEPIWAGRTSPGALPVMVAAFTEGAPFGSPATAARRSDALCREMAEHLARIHRLDWRFLGSIEGDKSDFNRRAVEQELDNQAAQMRTNGVPTPLLEYTLAWLRNNTDLISDRITIVHGDYAPHNLLAVGEEITAVLDWEFVKLGNPAEDLCFGRLAVEELGTWEDFCAAYGEGGAELPSPGELRFYTIFSLFRLCVMMMRTDAVFADSKIKAIRMVTPGAERLRPTLLKLARQLGISPAKTYLKGQDDAG